MSTSTSFLHLLFPPQHRILRNDIQLAATGLNECARLAQDCGHRTRPVLAADGRYGAIRATVNAAFGDLQIGKRLAGEAQGRHLRLLPVVRNANPLVHARESPLQPWIARGIAAGDDDTLVLSASLQLQRPEDFRLRFLSGRFDERTGVDDDDVRTVRIRRQRAAGLQQITGPHLQVDGILRTAEGNQR